VRKDAEVEPALYPITAHDNDPVFPGLDKVVVQNDFPLCMQELPVAKRHKRLAWRLFTTCLLHSKIFE
jgi:hypothetical protein